MRSASLFILVAMAATPALMASPCVPDQLSNYILLGGTGCQNGAFNVTDFSFNFVSGNVTILASDITVTPFSGTDFYRLDFTSPKFNLTNGTDAAKYLLGYTWDPGDLRSLEDVMNATSPVFPGFASVTTDGCVDAAFSGASCSTSIQTVTVTDDGHTAVLTDITNFSPPIGTLGVRNTLELDANGSTSEIAGFQNIVFTPEPSTLGAGLLALALAAGRSRLNRIQSGLQFLSRFWHRPAGLGGR
jgi:hypothetical protein